MDILIRGMEMPTTCGKCKIKNAIKCNRWELVRSVLLDRHIDCPLVPVPPHGRLIDADKIGLTDFEIILCQKGNPFKNALEMLLEKIENAPTIIPASEEGK